MSSVLLLPGGVEMGASLGSLLLLLSPSMPAPAIMVVVPNCAESLERKPGKSLEACSGVLFMIQSGHPKDDTAKPQAVHSQCPESLIGKSISLKLLVRLGLRSLH